MSETKEPATTHVVGYFNPERYPIHLVISKLNITLKIEPGDYIKDRQGRKINDPIFDDYKRLAKETSAVPVPLISVPVVQAVVPYSQDGHSVREVTQFATNKHGFRVPVMPAAMPAPVVAANASPVKEMTMEEARRRGYVRATRAVPEDYGVTDRDGPPVPVAEVPPMKYAIDSNRPATPEAALPPETRVLSDDSRTQRTAAARTQLHQALVEGQKTAEDLESETGFLNTVVQTPIVSKPAMPALPALPALPAPSLDDTPVQEELPAPPPPPPSRLAVHPASSKARRYFCQADGRSFENRDQLVAHVQRKFPHLSEALLAAYPVDAAP